MGRHIHLYSTEQEFEGDYNGTGYTEPWVSFTEDVERVDYNKHDEPVPVCDHYLVFDMTDFEEWGGSDNYLSSYPIKGASGSNGAYKFWGQVDGDIDYEWLDTVGWESAFTIAVTINNFNGRSETRVWNFPAWDDFGDYGYDLGFPFSASELGITIESDDQLFAFGTYEKQVGDEAYTTLFSFGKYHTQKFG